MAGTRSWTPSGPRHDPSHRLGLGLDLDLQGRVVDSEGRVNPSVYVVGAARRGIEWEVAAVPDLRAQAARLAAALVTPGTAVPVGAAPATAVIPA